MSNGDVLSFSFSTVGNQIGLDNNEMPNNYNR